MLGHTHILGGVTLSVTVSTISGLYMPYVSDNVLSSAESFVVFGGFMFGTCFGSLLPDIEKKGSTISNRFKLISFISRILFGHRGFTHSLLAVLLLGVIAFPITLSLPFLKPFFVGLIIGYLSHLLLDALNPTGVPLFYPLDYKITFANVTTGGIWEWAVFIILSFAFVTMVKNSAICLFDVSYIREYIENLEVYIKAENLINIFKAKFLNL